MKSYKLDMTEEEHQKLKIWAAQAKQTIARFLLDGAKEKAQREKLTSRLGPTYQGDRE